MLFRLLAGIALSGAAPVSLYASLSHGYPKTFEPISDDATVMIANLDHNENVHAARNNATPKTQTRARGAVQHLVSLYGCGVQAIKQQLDR